MKARNTFYILLTIAILAIVVLLATAIEITNPFTIVIYVAIAAVSLIVGYVLGKKSYK